MLQRPSVPPTGPRPPRAHRSNRRGGIQKRPGGPIRVDKDGDLDMEAAGGSAKDRGAGRGSRGGSQSRGTVGSRFGSGRDTNSSRLTRGSVDPTGMQKAILRGMGVDPRGSGLNSRTTKQAVKSLVKERDLNARAQWEQVIVRGFRKSKAASNPGGGIKDLIAFLERKATALVQKVCLTLCFPGHR